MQRDDSFILASGSFSWTDGPSSLQAIELGFILRVLRYLPHKSSITFYFIHPYKSAFYTFRHSSAERRIRLPFYMLWMAIFNHLQDFSIDCKFQTVLDAPADSYLSRYYSLASLVSSETPSPSFKTLIMNSLSSYRLLVVLLCNGFPLIIDPVHYWREFSNMRGFFELLNLSRFAPLRSSYSSIDWNLTFDTLKNTLYHRLDMVRISSSHRFRLQL